MTMIAVRPFAVSALAQDVADHVREHGRDPVWGHAAVTQVAAGFGPCRLCLRTFREGEDLRTLFTHDTYAGVAEFPQPGPVFVHAEPCARWDGDGFPPGLRRLALTFEGVAAGPRVVALERTRGAEAEAAIERLLGLAEVEYVNVRNTEAGCFVARVERADVRD
ncbi:MAG TPA: DUF1203 domain-containing protein [Gaiellaceae bacterium]|nr:DUF1203 domain-containing protein [Gaiellaceae bacterium]